MLSMFVEIDLQGEWLTYQTKIKEKSGFSRNPIDGFEFEFPSCPSIHTPTTLYQQLVLPAAPKILSCVGAALPSAMYEYRM